MNCFNVFSALFTPPPLTIESITFDDPYISMLNDPYLKMLNSLYKDVGVPKHMLEGGNYASTVYGFNLMKRLLGIKGE